MTCSVTPCRSACQSACPSACAQQRPEGCLRRGCAADAATTSGITSAVASVASCADCPVAATRRSACETCPRGRGAGVEPSVLTRSLAEFNTVFGAYTSERPTLDIPADVLALRLRLLREEFQELFDAIEVEKDLVNVAKEAADLAYVLQGTMAAFGLDLDAAIAEVHRSNMTKVGEDGKPLRDAGGKILKGPRYEQADIAAALGISAS